MSASPKAYSYTRFSTPEQAKGDSQRRQSGMAEDYVKRHGLTLDTELTLRDVGVSAFKGANLDGTAGLGAFLRAVEDGAVPRGSVLLVEALDRISRQTARKAVRVLEEIVEGGVDVVTLSDGKRYNAESLEGTDFLIAILLFMRGAEESQTKSRRVKAAWAAKRERKAGKGFGRSADVHTRHVPGWIRVTGKGLELIPERVKVVRKIFNLYLQGRGPEGIAQSLNLEKVPTFGRSIGWQKSYISKMLSSPSVIGTLPYVNGAQREGYYPVVIDGETWERAQALRAGKAKMAASRGSGAKSATLVLRNVLAGLAKCPKCGGTMTRVLKGGPRNDALGGLVCTKAKAGAGCTYRSVPLGYVQAALIRNAKVPLPPTDTSAGDELKGVDAAIEDMQDMVNGLAEALAITPTSAALQKQLAAREAKLAALEAKGAELAKRVAESDSKLLKRRVERYRKALTADPFNALAANTALREMASRIVVDYENGDLVVSWRHDGTTRVAYSLK